MNSPSDYQAYAVARDCEDDERQYGTPKLDVLWASRGYIDGVLRGYCAYDHEDFDYDGSTYAASVVRWQKDRQYILSAIEPETLKRIMNAHLNIGGEGDPIGLSGWYRFERDVYDVVCKALYPDEAKEPAELPVNLYGDRTL